MCVGEMGRIARTEGDTLNHVRQGPNEQDGWPLAGTIVPIASIGWSLWLVALGEFMLR